MSTTPQTNTTLDEIASVLSAHHSFAICGHVSPDGDCIGSQLGLAATLRELGKDVYCLLARDEPLDHTLLFLPGVETLQPACEFNATPEVFVAVDVPNEERLGDAAAVKARCAVSITVDHHAYDPAMSRYSYTDPDAASTTLLIWQLVQLLTTEVPVDTARCCYAGLVTDTGRFQYQNTDASCFDYAAEMVKAGADPAYASRELFQNRTLASLKLEERALAHLMLSPDGKAALTWVSREDFEACDAVKADSESLINLVRSLEGIRVACVLRDQGDEIRGSFRAKDDTDVACLARRFGGGGHKAAAGFTLHCSLEEAVKTIFDLLSGQF